MISQTVKNIIEEFDELLKIHGKDEEVSKLIAEDVKFVNLWREEIESEKQSIFIIGKTSTGKSEFHNFLLDLNNKEDVIFKTSTKVETGIIQTLEHCENRTTAYAEIIVKNRHEFNKLNIPQNINCELKEVSCKILLDNSERISFFRDKVIAKSDNSTTFNLMAAVTQVNIKYPLKYFKKYRIVDTPGLASSISGTDSIVKDYFHGKSHIFWFLDASTRTMPDNLKLLDKEKDLIKMSYDRINFIANKFDLMEYDDDNNSKDEVLKRKEELTSLLKKTLVDVIGIEDINPKITFTSFRHPKKKFGEHDTFHGIKSIEESLIIVKKESNYKNTTSFFSILKVIIKKINSTVIAKEKEMNNKLKDIKLAKNKILRKNENIKKQKSETLDLIQKAKMNIENIKKEDNLNTHEKYNKYVDKFKTEVKKYCEKINNSAKRIEGLNLNNFYLKLNQIKVIKDLTLKGNESLWKKYIHDGELDEKKKILELYIQIKINEFSSLKSILNEAVSKIEDDKINEIQGSIHKYELKKRKTTQHKEKISNFKRKLSNKDQYLLEDIENRVSQWFPPKSEENNTLLSFLDLYALLDEHRIIKEKI